jgi:2,4-dienoyl-CoA reductase (NADPH2)
MEAARMAALKGHRVTLVSRDRKLGGLMRIAAMVKGQEVEELEAIITYYRRQLAALGVTIRLGRRMTPQRVAELEPDQLILATGGVPTAPDLPGLNDCHKVVRSGELMEAARRALGFVGPETLRSLSHWWMPIGKRVVILGGAIAGCELAEFLVRRGRDVKLLHSGDLTTLGDGLTELMKRSLLPWLARRGVEVLVGARCDAISDEGLSVTTAEGESRLLAADSFVTALPLEPDTSLLDHYRGAAPVVKAVGDCVEPGLILDAVHSAAGVFAERGE